MEIAEDSSSSMEEDTPSFVEHLDSDVAGRIFNFLDEPIDLAHLAAVSRSYHRIVVENRCFKDLCIRISPEVSRFNSVMKEDEMSSSGRPSSSEDSKWTNLKMEHRVYGNLAHDLIGLPMEQSCICEHICASSTDNYPDESIMNTLDSWDRDAAGRPSYWSSKGESSKDVSETLTYRLHTNLSVVHEVKIRPFQAHFQRGSPIYSSNKVRFRFGYSSSSPEFNSSLLDGSMPTDRSPCEDYVWTYISQEYPMLKEDELQSFKLPRPVLCIGDILQVELLGRVQKQEMDGLYYICVCHVHVVGRPLSSISFEVRSQPRQYSLKYSEHQEDQRDTSSDWYSIAERIRQIRAGRVLPMSGNFTVVNFNPRDDQDSDEDGNIDLFLD